MKTSVFAGISLSAIALAGGAQAADLAYKAPIAAPVPWSWTGFYVGANIGGVSAKNTVSDANGLEWIGQPVDANKTGVIGGLQAGFNWQINSLVLGVEGDISFASVNRSVDFQAGLAGTPNNYSADLRNFGTVRGRIGLAFDRLLVYGTGGAAFANINNTYKDFAFNVTMGPSSGVTGWVAGGGLEYAISDHWTARAEYLHADFGERTAAVTTGLGADYAFAFKNTVDIGRAGINYKF